MKRCYVIVDFMLTWTETFPSLSTRWRPASPVPSRSLPVGDWPPYRDDSFLRAGGDGLAALTATWAGGETRLSELCWSSCGGADWVTEFDSFCGGTLDVAAGYRWVFCSPSRVLKGELLFLLLLFGLRSPSLHTCHFKGRTSRRTPLKNSGIKELLGLIVKSFKRNEWLKYNLDRVTGTHQFGIYRTKLHTISLGKYCTLLTASHFSVNYRSSVSSGLRCADEGWGLIKSWNTYKI